ncbi:transcriptional regulator [alpha proteobacterium AAP81b]|nr:transcriptional regulator [alpha proteobacterium AAP81b]
MKSEKITEAATSRRRRYDDACGTAHALDLIGDRWALLVMRELLLGPRRFAELRADLPGISANVLTQRLGELEAIGVVVRQRLPPPAAVQVYALTDWGAECEPILAVLGRWATRSPWHDPTLPLSAVSLLISFRTMFDPARAGDLRATIGFRIGAGSYRVAIAAGTLAAERGNVVGTDAVITAPAPAIAGVVYAGQPLAGLDIAGDAALVARFVTLFPLPAKVGVTVPAAAP